MHYYKFNIADWNLGTSHLSLAEEAIYFRLINHYYDTESPIPLETQSVFRRLRMGSDKELAIGILEEFFTKTDNGWIHERCEKILKEYRKTANKNKKNGAGGGRPRKDAASKETQEKPSGFSVGTQSEPKDNPNQEPLTTNHKPITNNQDKDKNTLVDTGVSTDSLDDSNTDKPPSCPHAEIIAAYHEILPELDSVVVSLWKPSTKRYKWLQARWRESDKHQSLEFWRRFFRALRNYPFYMGTNDRQWKANLEWMVKQENFIKLIEKFRSDAKRQ